MGLGLGLGLGGLGLGLGLGLVRVRVEQAVVLAPAEPVGGPGESSEVHGSALRLVPGSGSRRPTTPRPSTALEAHSPAHGGPLRSG